LSYLRSFRHSRRGTRAICLAVTSALRNAWVDHPRFDYVIVVSTGALALAGSHFGLDPIANLDRAARHSWYQQLAEVSGALLGLAVAASAILIALTPGPRLARALKRIGRDLYRLITSTLVGLAVCTAGFALLTPLDTAPSASGVRFGAIALFTLGALRVSRMMWLMNVFFGAMAAEAEAVEPPLDRTWSPPTITDSDYEAVPFRRIRMTRR